MLKLLTVVTFCSSIFFMVAVVNGQAKFAQSQIQQEDHDRGTTFGIVSGEYHSTATEGSVMDDNYHESGTTMRDGVGGGDGGHGGDGEEGGDGGHEGQGGKQDNSGQEEEEEEDQPIIGIRLPANGQSSGTKSGSSGAGGDSSESLRPDYRKEEANDENINVVNDNNNRMEDRVDQGIKDFLRTLRKALNTVLNSLANTDDLITEMESYAILTEEYQRTTAEWLEQLAQKINGKKKKK